MNNFILTINDYNLGLCTDACYQEVAETINNIRRQLNLKFTYILSYNKYNKRFEIEFYRISQLVDFLLNRTVLFGQKVNDYKPKEFPEIISTNHRIIGAFIKGGFVKFKFYNGDCDNSHHELFEKFHKENPNIDWDAMRCTKTADGVEESIGIFGAFYSLMHNNNETLLCIYGSSCDYPTHRLTEKRLRDYKNELKFLCEQKKWKLVWKV